MFFQSTSLLTTGDWYLVLERCVLLSLNIT